MDGSPAHSEKAMPDPNTDFGNEAIDYNAIPQKRISFSGINEWIFGLMRPKRDISAKIQSNATIVQSNPAKPYRKINPIDGHAFNPDYAISNGLIFKKKTLPERVRDSLKFPAINNVNSLVTGIAMIAFVIGSFIIYSELPTRPELVLGILIVAISANVIISNR